MNQDNRSYYDEFSTWYENERHHGYHAMIDDLEFDILKPYLKGKDVLEIGCGTGLILERAAEISKTALGIDISEGMLKHALDRGLEGVLADVTHLPFADESFDLVYSFKVLAHVEDIDRALKEMARVTRPGGILVLEFYNKLSGRYLAKKIAGPQKISDKTHEGAVFTRWDTPMDLKHRLPSNLSLIDYSGVRVITPFAGIHKLPVIGSIFSKGEFLLRDSPAKYLGGFLVMIAEKK